MKRRLRQTDTHPTDRAEFFSDAVFGVAITLLALDLLRIHADPGVGDGTLFGALGTYWPVILAFATAFAFIGVSWMNHHNVFARVERISRSLQAANLMLLAGVILVPWAAATLAEALAEGHGEQEVLLFAAVLIFNAVAWFCLFNVLGRHPELLVSPSDAPGFAADRFSALTGVAVGVVGAIVAYMWSPIAATALFLVVPVFYAVVAPGFERAE